MMNALSKWMCCGLAVILCCCVGSNRAKDRKEAEAFYKFEFNVDAGPEVREIHAEQLVIYDTVVAWLEFKAPQAVIDNLLKTRGFMPIIPNSDELEELKKNPNNPEWWRMGGDMLCFRNRRWDVRYPNSTAYLAYREETGEVVFVHTAYH